VLKLVSGLGWREGAVGAWELPVLEGTPAGRALATRQAVIVEDLAGERGFPDASFLREHGVVSGVTIPIIGQEGPLGVLGVHADMPRTFSEDDVDFLRSVATVLADGLERLRKEEELHRTLGILRATDDERRRLLSRLVRVQEEERERIAADIHDDSIQVMTALSIRVQMLRDELFDPEQLDRLDELERVLEKTIGRLRHLLFELRPPALDREGLTAALREYLERMGEEDGPAYSLDDRLVGEPETEARVIVYRIAQEALMNVRKHARASTVDVSLDERDGGVFVSIRDDGQGFSPDNARVGLPGHLGMTAMRERAEMAGGWLKILSRPGSGTSIDFWVPAEKARAEKAAT
jgi:signal transduction histidine kinase